MGYITYSKKTNKASKSILNSWYYKQYTYRTINGSMRLLVSNNIGGRMTKKLLINMSQYKQSYVDNMVRLRCRYVYTHFPNTCVNLYAYNTISFTHDFPTTHFPLLLAPDIPVSTCSVGWFIKDFVMTVYWIYTVHWL